MSKKGHTNNPGGRPLKKPEEKVQAPPRMFGRVSDEDWDLVTGAAAAAGKSFTRWALDILIRAAKRQK